MEMNALEAKKIAIESAKVRTDKEVDKILAIIKSEASAGCFSAILEESFSIASLIRIQELGYDISRIGANYIIEFKRAK